MRILKFEIYRIKEYSEESFQGYIASLEHSYLSLYFVCQLYNWSYSLKLRFFPCAILFQQSHITKHTSVSSPRKTLITTTLSTKCLSYCNISKPSHMCMPKWRPVFFREHFNFCRDHNCTMYKKKQQNSVFPHTLVSLLKLNLLGVPTCAVMGEWRFF